MRMKRFLCGIISFIVGITILFLGCQKRIEKFSIGSIIPLTGEWARYGNQMKKGMDLAVKILNEEGGINGKNFEILYEDGQARPKESIQAFNKLIQVNKVPAVISGFSGVILSLSPIANSNTVVLLNCGATNPEIEDAGDYIFSDIPNANYEAKYLAEFLYNSLKSRNVAIFWQNNDAGIGMRGVFKNTFEKLGGKIIISIGHEQGQTQFKTELIQIKEHKPEAVFVPTYSKEMGLILRQAHEIRFNTQFVNYAAFEVKEVLEIAGDYAEGAIYSYYSYDPNSSDENVRKFHKRFIEEYNEEPGLYSATFYDGVMIIGEALKKGHTSGTEIKNYLYTIKNFPGASGEISFNKKGAVVMPLQIKTVKEGKFVKYGKK